MKHKLSAVLLSAALLSAGWLGITGFTLFFALVPLLAVSESYDSRAARGGGCACGAHSPSCCGTPQRYGGCG